MHWLAHYWFTEFWPRLQSGLPGVLANTFMFTLVGGTFIFRMEQKAAKLGNHTLLRAERWVWTALKAPFHRKGK